MPKMIVIRVETGSSCWLEWGFSSHHGVDMCSPALGWADEKLCVSTCVAQVGRGPPWIQVNVHQRFRQLHRGQVHRPL